MLLLFWKEAGAGAGAGEGSTMLGLAGGRGTKTGDKDLIEWLKRKRHEQEHERPQPAKKRRKRIETPEQPDVVPEFIPIPEYPALTPILMPFFPNIGQLAAANPGMTAEQAAAFGQGELYEEDAIVVLLLAA